MAYRGKNKKHALADYVRNGGVMRYANGQYEVGSCEHLYPDDGSANDADIIEYNTLNALMYTGLTKTVALALMYSLPVTEVKISVCEWRNDEARRGFSDTAVGDNAQESMHEGFTYYNPISTGIDVIDEHAKAVLVMRGIGSYYDVKVNGRSVDVVFDLIINQKQ
jgi:hypothetical protein